MTFIVPPQGDFIAGRFITASNADSSIVVTSPADTNDHIATYSVAVQHVFAAVQAAQDAFKPWRRLSSSARDDYLRRYQAALRSHSEAIAQTITREVGKPIAEARGEMSAMVNKVDMVLGEGRSWTPDKVLADLPGHVRHRPLGVVAIIGPFNFPGHLPNGQIVPALAAGNTIVFKPSERAPGTGAWLAQCANEAGFPSGVFNLVQGHAASAQALVQHDALSGILFTGSLPVGKAIVAANVERVGRLIALELGGKNASIVLADANLELAVEQVAFAAFATSGQRCTSTSRVIVADSIVDLFCEKLVGAVQKLQVGYPFDPSVFMGPVISDAARAGILHAQTTAVAAGYEPLLPGRSLEVPGRPGWYLSPSILRAPADRRHVPGYSDAELFGPDLAVYAAADTEDALALANDTPFGLVAAVFTQSQATFEYCASELEVGAVHWNRSTAGASGLLPFGGIKQSGNHRPAGILAGQLCAYPQAILGTTPSA